MPNVTDQSSLPLNWELSLPQHIIEEAQARCAKKNVEEFVLYEHTNEYLYALTVCAFTAIFHKYVKLVHWDNQLHIFMRSKFDMNDLLLIRRIFQTTNFMPDAVLNDMLVTKQAMFTIREQEEGRVVETRFLELSSYEGPTEYSEIRDVLESQGITNTKDFVAVVYDVVSVDEHVYENAKVDEIYVPVKGSAGERHLDTLAYAAELSMDVVKLRSLIGNAERHFKKTKYKATPR